MPARFLNVRFTVFSFASLMYVTVTLSPGLYRLTCSTISGPEATFTPFIFVTTSPFLIPARSAAKPAGTPLTNTPSTLSFTPISAFCSSLRSFGAYSIPKNARCTVPNFIRSLTTFFTIFTGIA